MGGLLWKIANFANDAGGIEKTLKFVQAYFQIAAATATANTKAQLYSTGRGHLALARRYLRLFKWIDFSQVASREWEKNADPVRRFISVAKFGLLALYFLEEMFCITNAMKMTSSAFLDDLQHHALQVWFLSIAVSILLTTYDIFFGPKFGRNIPTARDHAMAYLIDVCDILIPGSAVGWIPVGPVIVGIASCLSSRITGGRIWTKVQLDAQARELSAAMPPSSIRQGRDGKYEVDPEGWAINRKRGLKQAEKKGDEAEKKKIAAWYDGMAKRLEEEAAKESQEEKVIEALKALGEEQRHDEAGKQLQSELDAKSSDVNLDSVANSGVKRRTRKA